MRSPLALRHWRVHPQSALTTIELLIVVGILGVLIILAGIAMGPARSRAELAACASNLKSLYVAFATCTNDHGQWPQVSEELSGRPREQFWVNALRPYGIGEANWKCPTISRDMAEFVSAGEEPPLTHYDPTPFDENALTPYKWPTHPWLVEIGDAHGHGPLTILTNGAVRNFNDIFTEAGGQPIQ